MLYVLKFINLKSKSKSNSKSKSKSKSYQRRNNYRYGIYFMVLLS